jgi:mannose-6-phosphate isomerase-like protein (cupin superfamily)
MAVELDVGHPTLLAPGEGETISDRAERNVVIKCDHELVDVTWTRYEAGERGPDPHIHEQHADAWYVLEGELTFGLGPGGEEQVRAPAGTLVLVPAGVIHTFGNDGSATAHFLNVHAPSMGFAESLRTSDLRWDSFDPPDDGGLPASHAIVRGPGEGEVLDGTSRLVFKAEGDDGDGTVFVGESTLAAGFPGPPPHRHERHLDSFYVLEGTLTVLLGDREVEAEAGSFAAVPPGVRHTFSNRSDGEVRVLNVMAPGGFERYLKEIWGPTAPGEAPDPALVAQITPRYDIFPA